MMPSADPSTGSDDLLAQFAPETPQTTAGPDSSIQNSTFVPRIVARLPTASHTSERRPRWLVPSLAITARIPTAPSPEAPRVRRKRQVRQPRRLSAGTTFVSFVGGAAAAVFVMWFVGVEPALPLVPSTTHAVTPVPTLPPQDRSGVPQDVQPVDEGTRASSAPAPSSNESPVPRTVGTSGRSTADVNRAAKAPRAGAARSANRTNSARTPGAYRGSLVLRSAPQNARVFLNGAFVGSTPLVLENLPVGSRAVRMEADGYQRWSAAARIVANQQTRVSATLSRVAP